MLYLLVLAVTLFSFINTRGSNLPVDNELVLPPVNVPCNTDVPVPITALNYSDLSVTKSTTGLCVLNCSVTNEANIIDADESNFSTVVTDIGVGITHTITVTDNTVDEFFNAGGYAGFLLGTSSVLEVDLLNAITVRTYLDGTLQELNTSSSLAVVQLLAGSQYYVGFYTTMDYDAIEISISSLAGVLSATNIYHAVSSDFCPGPALVCNTPTMLSKPDFPAKIVDSRTGFGGVLSVGTIVDANAAIDSNSSSYASIDFTLGVLATGSLSIKDELTDYPEQTYVGFDIENSSVLNLDLLDGTTINTYLDGVLQESQSGSSELLSVGSGLLFTGSERSQIGFVTSLPFDEVQLSIQQTVSLDLGSTRVYGLVLESFCEGTLACSEATLLNNPSQPVIINNTNTGINGIACIGCEVDNATNVVSESNSDFAMINVVAGVASTASISVENVLDTFQAGSQAGFVIRDTNDLLEVDLLSSLTISTYLDGTLQESVTASSLLSLEALGLISITPSSTNGYQLVGFNTTLDYDEIQLTVGSLVGVINSIEVYGGYVDTSMQIEGTIINETAIGLSDGNLSISVSGGTPPYSYLWSPNGETTDVISGLTAGTYSVTVTDALDCQKTAEFIVYTDGVQYPVPCNTIDPVAITASGFTDLSITENTTGLCVAGCGVLNSGNIIDSDTDTFATIATLVGLGVTHTLTVTDETASEFFTAGGYAGFLIENSSVLQVDLLDAIVVRTYLDGNLQEVNTSTSLAAINSSLLGSDAYYVGFYTTMDYDAIEISISSLAGVLSTTNVYHAVTNSFCEGPDLACNTPTVLTKPDFPVRIVDEHTGTGGLLGVGSVNNTSNLFDSNYGNYATIDLLAGLAATASLAVKNELTDYPAETYAGFDIENATLLNTQLFDAITITTYLDGTLVESRTGATELVPVNSGLLLTGTESTRIGFVTTAPFDEVQITMSQLVSLSLGSTRVYGLVLESFCPGIINCDEPYVLSNPNDSVIINNNRTGTDGLICAACEVDNTQNVISEDDSDFAMINVVAGVAASGSISVQDVLTDYPAGTTAGFVIRDTNDLLQVDLLNSITITTYLDDVQQEQQTASNLLALEALGLVNITPTSTDAFYIVAFETTLAFDEVQITAGSLASVINSLEVYGGYIDATTTGFCQSADIALIKVGVFNDEDGDSCSDVGETITYTFTVTNQGNASITNVVLDDPMLGGAIALASGDNDSDTELDVDETWIYTMDYTITQANIDAGSVSNQATITGTSTGGVDVSDLSDDDSITEDEVTETMLCQSADIALIKVGVFNDEDSDSCSDVGETITYTFTVTNQGNASITNVVLDDPMLGGTIALASGDDDSDTELDVDETWIYTMDYTITQANIDAGSVSNQATVTGTSTGGVDVSDLSDDDSITEDEVTETMLCQSADIALIKVGVFNDEDSDSCSDVGETITYTFTVTNQGNASITNVILDDPMLGGTIALASGDDDSDTELDVDETWIYTMDYTITQANIDAGSVSNQATITGTSTGGVDVSDLSDDDSITENEVTETMLCQSADIALIKVGVFNDEDSDSCSDVGETITYTFTVTNQGNASITNVVLDDPMLGGAIALASGDNDSDTELDVDETWIYTMDYTITQANIDAGSVSNQATITGTSTGGVDVSDLSDDDSITEDEVTETMLCQSADIALIKVGVFNDEDSDSCSDVGETITYTFTVTNQGNASITNVVLDDPMLGGTIALASGDDDSDTELDVDETWIYTMDYTITQANIDAGSVSNQATITGTSTGGVDVSDLSDDDSITEDEVTETMLCQSADIALIKVGVFNDEDSDSCSDVGETITYTFTVTNQGNASITNVVLDDPMLGGTIALASGDDDSDTELDVDETWIYTMDYTITQANIDAGSVSNQATVTGTSTGGVDVSDLSDDDSITEDEVTETMLCQSADIALIKVGVFNDEDSDSCSDVGETITYTFTVTNQGNASITNVILDDPMLGGTIALASGDDDSDTELDVDETWIYTMDYTITQANIDAGSVSNQATVTGTSTGGVDVSDLSDDDSITEDEVTETMLCQSADIALIKVGVFNDEDGDSCSDVGETITYTFTVTNQGNAIIDSVELNDDMLGGVIALASGDLDNDGELDFNETWLYTSTYVITQADINNGLISNQAIVSGISVANGTVVADLSDDDSVLEDDPTVTLVCNSSSVSLEKVAVFNDENGSGAAQVGETITYTFTVYNTGLSTLYDIVIQDALPGIEIQGGPISELLPGEIDDSTFTATYTITQADINNMLVTNQAEVIAFDASGNTITDTSDDPTNLEDVDINDDGEPDDPTVTVLPSVLNAGFEIFNGITPDGDGLNDFFLIEGIENFPNNNLKIFNRWGVKVYETDGYGISGNVFRGVSDGRVTISKNEELPTGTYFYILTRQFNQQTLNNQGYLYIKRN